MMQSGKHDRQGVRQKEAACLDVEKLIAGVKQEIRGQGRLLEPVTSKTETYLEPAKQELQVLREKVQAIKKPVTLAELQDRGGASEEERSILEEARMLRAILAQSEGAAASEQYTEFVQHDTHQSAAVSPSVEEERISVMKRIGPRRADGPSGEREWQESEGAYYDEGQASGESLRASPHNMRVATEVAQRLREAEDAVLGSPSGRRVRITTQAAQGEAGWDGNPESTEFQEHLHWIITAEPNTHNYNFSVIGRLHITLLKIQPEYYRTLVGEVRRCFRFIDRSEQYLLSTELATMSRSQVTRGIEHMAGLMEYQPACWACRRPGHVMSACPYTTSITVGLTDLVKDPKKAPRQQKTPRQSRRR